MEKGMYAILRFAKHQGYPAKKIEDHHERNKETYASNPDIDLSRTGGNFHIISPMQKYYAEIQQRIDAAQCRTRKDSVRFVDTLIAASPQFFEEKTEDDIRAYYAHACRFLEERIGRQNIISAVVHMDEKTPHMHLVFVPLTSDHRLSAETLLATASSLSPGRMISGSICPSAIRSLNAVKVPARPDARTFPPACSKKWCA